MPSVLKNTNFADRLRRLYSDAGYDLKKSGWSAVAAKDMFDRGIITYNCPENTAECAKQRASAANRMRQHLLVESAGDVSGIWLTYYCRFFNCSAAFLFGEIEEPGIAQTHICEATNLSPAAVKVLLSASDRFPYVAETVNMILTNKGGLLHDLWEYTRASDNIKVMSPDEDDSTVTIYDAGDGQDVAVAHTMNANKLYFAALERSIMLELENIRNKKKRGA